MMTCEEIRELLQDAFDGTLESDVAEAVAAHLAGCTACSGEMETLHRLAESTRGLPEGIAPARDLWPDIADRITGTWIDSAPDRRRNRRFPAIGAWARVAAAAALVLVVAWGARGLMRGPSPDSPRVSSSMLVASLESEYRGVVTELWNTVRDHRDVVPVETMAVIESNLQLIDSAIEDSRNAVVSDPENSELQIQLSRIWQKKIALLDRTARIAARYQ